ncbi:MULTISPECIES: uroporphyrinogen-III synthase [unclassified Listeria]|uniref:uroporphyrinogen-III synthase n=1 Tax=unclassified Listeria TaxID=2642072 RepID=UPI000B591AF9|nr:MULTISPECIES: uroporphyrinogen-III synthase [unclassified Listeria]
MKTVVLTREVAKNHEAIRNLEKKAIRAISIPLIETRPLPLEQEIILDTYDWLFFTSQNAVHYFFKRFKKCPPTLKIAVIGSKTADALKKYNLHADFIPSEFETEAFVFEWLQFISGNPAVLFPQSLKGRSVIPTLLKEKGILVNRVFLYDTFMPEVAPSQLRAFMEAEDNFYIAFASPSAWENFKKIIKKKAVCKSVKIASIGSVTSEAIERDGFKVDVQPTIFTMDNLLKEIENDEF